MKKLHYFSGITLAVFITAHLLNHLVALVGLQQHIALMERLRTVYRNPVVETLLLAAVSVQIYSGIILFVQRRKNNNTVWMKLQNYSGLYLALFFIVHVMAIIYGRTVEKLDTNIYYGIAGLNTYPYFFFFVPYYGLGIISFFTHIAAIHMQKMHRKLLGMPPQKQAMAIIITGIAFTVTTLYALTNGFKGYALPKSYQLNPITVIHSSK